MERWRGIVVALPESLGLGIVAIRSLARSPFTRANAFVEGQVSDRVRYL
jgi:hypothetical protein